MQHTAIDPIITIKRLIADKTKSFFFILTFLRQIPVYRVIGQIKNPPSPNRDERQPFRGTTRNSHPHRYALKAL